MLKMLKKHFEYNFRPSILCGDGSLIGWTGKILFTGSISILNYLPNSLAIYCSCFFYCSFRLSFVWCYVSNSKHIFFYCKNLPFGLCKELCGTRRGWIHVHRYQKTWKKKRNRIIIDSTRPSLRQTNQIGSHLNWL